MDIQMSNICAEEKSFESTLHRVNFQEQRKIFEHEEELRNTFIYLKHVRSRHTIHAI